MIYDIVTISLKFPLAVCISAGLTPAAATLTITWLGNVIFGVGRVAISNSDGSL